MRTDLDEWRELNYHANTARHINIQNHTSCLTREKLLTHRIANIDINCTRNLVVTDTITLLMHLAHACEIPNYIQKLFNGEKINFTENRAALHAALRTPALYSGHYHSQMIAQNVFQTLDRVKTLSNDIRSQNYLSAANKPIKNIVHIGIGGSDLGPRMVTAALQKHSSSIQTYFISNVDPIALHDTLAILDPTETIIIIVSKTFTTIETLTNARIAINWIGQTAVKKQCFAITESIKNAEDFGIESNNILPIWNWVGGRFSLWSAVSLCIAIQFGFDTFSQLLTGANLIDQHIVTSSIEQNVPLLLALLDVWHVNFLHCQTRAIIPYMERAALLPSYLQQLMMESNGKRIDLQGNFIPYATCPIIWGGVGSDSQHAFHQLLMQGSHNIPIDFINQRFAPREDLQTSQDLLNQLLSAQSDAMLYGNKHTENNIFKQVKANQSHTLMTIDTLDATTLGSLIAIYEYRTLFAATIWNINPFDQFGVELGKQLFKNRAASIELYAEGTITP